jgi:hypothetical protein
MGQSVRPLIGLMKEKGVSRLQSLAHGWFLDATGDFSNPKSFEFKTGNIDKLQKLGAVFNEMNTVLNPYFAGAGGDSGNETSLVESEEFIFRMENDMQRALRQNIEQLERGLQIADRGAERQVQINGSKGKIDITAEDQTGTIVVIELKAQTAEPDSVAQTLAYMTAVQAEDKKPVRGILVAADFHPKVLSAARQVGNFQLKRYAFNFVFRDP